MLFPTADFGHVIEDVKIYVVLGCHQSRQSHLLGVVHSGLNRASESWHADVLRGVEIPNREDKVVPKDVTPEPVSSHRRHLRHDEVRRAEKPGCVERGVHGDWRVERVLSMKKAGRQNPRGAAWRGSASGML